MKSPVFVGLGCFCCSALSCVCAVQGLPDLRDGSDSRYTRAVSLDSNAAVGPMWIDFVRTSERESGVHWTEKAGVAAAIAYDIRKPIRHVATNGMVFEFDYFPGYSCICYMVVTESDIHMARTNARIVDRVWHLIAARGIPRDYDDIIIDAGRNVVPQYVGEVQVVEASHTDSAGNPDVHQHAPVAAGVIPDSSTQANVTVGAPLLLAISLDDNGVKLSWPTNATGFVLEDTSTFSPGTWSTSAAQVHVVGGSFTVTNRVGAAQQFFRLRKR